MTSPLTFSKLFLKTLTEGAVTPEAYCSISQPSSKILTVSFGGGSHFGLPCRGAVLGRVELEGGKTSSDQYQKGPRIS